jgi:hypothetical protein
MAEESFEIVRVKCKDPDCEAEQDVRVRHFPPGSGYSLGSQTIPCIVCGEDFDVRVEGKIVGDPFLAAESAGG